MKLLTSQSAALTAPPTGEPAPRPAGPISRFTDGELPAEISVEVLCLRNEVHELRTMILSQNALLEQLVRRQAQIRVSRGQERALRAAVRMRAGELAEDPSVACGDSSPFRGAKGRRAIGSAILKTVREISGCRALGDVPAEKYDQILSAVQGWYMPGALRRIRKQLG